VIAAAVLLAAAMPAPGHALAADDRLIAQMTEVYRSGDAYRQCLLFDSYSEPSHPANSRAEDLDARLRELQDKVVLELLRTGRGDVLQRALSLVRYTRVDKAKCVEFDPYYEPALSAVEAVEASLARGAKR
jgi:uncharacterized protein (UPF0262 family)